MGFSFIEGPLLFKFEFILAIKVQLFRVLASFVKKLVLVVTKGYKNSQALLKNLQIYFLRT
ncbi:hypothetical protein DMC01_06550 [Campylobacter troglodytis]|nr:hypothetical protein DMC01_06550 [Campylobacter troglodytis]